MLCLLDLMKDRAQNGIFILHSVSPIEKVAALLGRSGKLKQALGLRWEIHISQLQAGRETDKLIGMKKSGIVGTVKDIISKLNNEVGSTVIMLPANHPR